METPRVADLTVDKLWALLHDKMQTLIRKELHEVLDDHVQGKSSANKRLPLELPEDGLGPWSEGLTFCHEDIYGDKEWNNAANYSHSS